MKTPRASGTYNFTPTRGDCVVQPLTAGYLRFDLLLID
jgi:hypothetical protein